MPYGGTTPEQDKKIERCVSEVMPKLVSKYPDEKERKSHAIAICKSQIMDTKSFFFTDLEIKSEEENIYIEGIASSINKDLGNDILTEDCLKQMAGIINDGNVKIGYDHTELLGGRPTLEAVGRLIEAKIENGKLWIKGMLDNTFSHFNEIKQKIQNKFLDGLSIEYQVDPDKTEVNFIEGIRHRVINGLKTLIGVAMTPRPMNQDAYFDYYIKHLEIKEAFSKDKPGEGGRFEACVEKMRARGAKDPKALCAWIGRRKYGKGKFQKMATQGKSEEIPDEYYDVSQITDEEVTIYINDFKKMHCPECDEEVEEDEMDNHMKEKHKKGENMEEKTTLKEQEITELKRLADLGKQVEEQKAKESKMAEIKSLALEAFKAEMKNIQDKQPYLNPEEKFGFNEESPFETELKNWRDAISNPKVDIETKYQAAAELHNKLHSYGITKRMAGTFAFKKAGRNFRVSGNGQNIELKSFEYKAQLEHDTNKVSDVDYYQNAAELNDIYDPVIVSHLNDKTTLWGLMKKKNVANIGSDRYGFRIWRTRIEGAGGDTSTYNYDEGATLTGYHSKMLKCQIPFMQYGVTVQVSGLTIAEARGSVGDIFAEQIKRASADLLRGINSDLYGTADGMTDGGKIMGLDLLGDDGGAYANVYGHARATYATLQGTDDAQTGSPNPDKVLLRKALRTPEKNGANREQLIFACDQIQRDKILGLLDPAQRFNNTSARAGFEGLPTFDGVPIHADDQCNDGYIYVLPMDSYYAAMLVAPTYEDLAKTDDSKKGFIKTYFAVVCENPNWVYKITGLATT